MKIRSKVLTEGCNYLWVTAGCFLYALAFSAFFDTNGFAMGGFTGMAQILNRLSGGRIPIGISVFVLNLPLMALLVRKQGIRPLVFSLYAITLVAAFIDTLTEVCAFRPMADPLLGCLFGSILMGSPLGFLMLRGVTTGGTELLARLLKYKFRHFSIGRLCLIIDVIVVCLYALTFGQLVAAMYGIVAMYISSRVIDMVVYGSAGAKLAIVVSSQSEAITKKLLTMKLGVTLLEGVGAFHREKKNIVLCVFKKHRIAAIKEVAKACDPGAFVIVCQAHEVLGEGFGQYSEDDL